VEHLSTLDKTSGTEGERKAHEYVRAKLEEYGVSFNAYEFDSLISHPKEASLEIVSPTSIEIECITHAFSKPTPENGIESGLVYIPEETASPFAGIEGLVDRYQEVGVEGKIALIQGLASPGVVWAAQQAGALAQVHISGDEVIHEMIVTTVWGTPTPESAERIPKITAVSVKKSDGEKLIELLDKGAVRVRVHANTDTKVRKIPFTEAVIKGAEEPNYFMLVHGHMDSWYVGTTDNCTGNAALLELARLFWNHRDELKRGIRIAWWAGHSTGRYSGSTWYADTFFEDLDRYCFLAMNIDSPGVKGASQLAGGGLMGTMEFFGQAVRDATGVEEVRLRDGYMRAGDESFYGIGIPSVRLGASIPRESELRGISTGGGGGGVWWHTEHDTLDKGDKENLLRDLRMETLAILRSVNSTILPFDFVSVAEKYEEAATDIQTQAASGTFSLDPLHNRIKELKARSEALNKAIEGVKDADNKKISQLNESLIMVSRILTSTMYTYTGKYDQDPAYGMPPLSTIQGVINLANMDPESEQALFLRTKMIREMNKINHQLAMAISLIDKAIGTIRG
jgi:hypothetical protein